MRLFRATVVLVIYYVSLLTIDITLTNITFGLSHFKSDSVFERNMELFPLIPLLLRHAPPISVHHFAEINARNLL